MKAATGRIEYREHGGWESGYLALVGLLGALILAGLGGAYVMESEGHWVTGMSHRIVWGTPHVFAVYLIVAASGALNVASISSVFDRALYKPLARLSGVLAISLLAGGLAVLVLDLGRPDRLVVAMTAYNFKSIFAWNIFLYTGFFAVAIVYLWMMMEGRMNRFAKPAGTFAFLWRLVLTTGTGSIFGFLVARQAYDSAVMAPMFIAMSLAFGHAIFLLVVMAASAGTGRPLGDEVVRRLKNLLGIFLAATLYFVAVQHLTNLYIAERQGIERFLLAEGGVYTWLFWIGHVALGCLVPIALVFSPATAGSRSAAALAAALAVCGGIAQIYVIIIGGQAYPLVLVPGMEVAGSVLDSGIAAYAPSVYEIALGLGGVALALLMVVLAVKVLPILPETLADAAPAA
ncbi:MAG: molybdopterin oxidoreductase [Rhodospirillales bacterium RIFCSPLOWO2_12_FULL_67_15]|nr:MAG: molybdopterin oxidoreductase [Rhodospirillales bacterium RIFCSPLOWO2_12_FULL_67_15]